MDRRVFVKPWALFRLEGQGVDHGDDASLVLRKGKPVEGLDHARDDSGVGKRASAVLRARDHALPINGKTGHHAAFEARIVAQAVHVAAAEPPKVVAYDPLNDLG